MYQLIVVANIAACAWTEPNRKPGDVVWVRTEDAARHLVENGLCKWPAAGDGPREVKPMEPSERKSFGDRMDGPSTDSPSSRESGPDKSLSASAAALVLPQRM